MSPTDVLAFGAIAIAIIFALVFVKRKYSRQPPGPINLPLVGVIPFLGCKPYVKFAEWGRLYGPVVRVKIGLKTVIVLNSYDAMVEAFVKKGKYFNHRAPDSLLRLEMKGLGLLNNEGIPWIIHRRFTTQCLKDLGFGRMSIEGHILHELENLITDIESVDKPIDPRDAFTTTVANITWSTVAGRSFRRNDPKLLNLAEMNDAVIKSLGTMGILNFYPQLRFLFRKKYDDFKNAMDELKNFLQLEINEHRQLLSGLGCGDDLISRYLTAGEEMNADNDKFTDEQIRAVLLDLFIAGLETTVTLYRWAILILLKYPQVQSKLQAEIDEVITDDRLPSHGDRLKMPYTEAFMAEIMRFSCVVPMVHHCTSSDTSIFDYKIKAGTPVIGNIWSIHKDEKLWVNPHEFDVTRFIDKSGKFQKGDHFMPFGFGKRACPGEGLARMEFFLFITCLLQKLSFSPTIGSRLCLEPESGLVMAPKKYEVWVERRVKNSTRVN